MTDCLNCGASLTGRYCASCGQEHQTGKPSVGRLIGEATANLVDADSRLWRTMVMLLVYPGRLASLYFEGKRARFLPPFRLYLATSLIFFMLWSLDSSAPTVTREQATAAGEPEVAATQTISEAGTEIDATGQTTPPASPESTTQSPVQLKPEAPPLTEYENDSDVVEVDEDSPLNWVGKLEDCDLRYSGPWRDFVEPRAINACKRGYLDGGETLFKEFIGYIPTAMFIMMPFFALAMKLFYWQPQRFFMEHLLFQLFNHSAFFTGGAVATLLRWVLPLGDDVWIDGPFSIYLLWYVYRSLRVFYGQGRKTTIAKFLALGVIYGALMMMAFLFAGLATVI